MRHQRRSFQIDEASIPDSLKFITPKGKVVYGGGGIYPDVYVPIDMKPETYMVNEVLNSGLTNFFLFEYLDKHPSQNRRPSKAYFITDYKISKEMLKAFAVFLKNRRIQIDFNRNVGDISKHLKASLAEIWFNDNVAGLIRNQNDFYIEKCLYYYKAKHTTVSPHKTRTIKRRAANL